MIKIKEKTYDERCFIRIMNHKRRYKRIAGIVSGVALIGVGVPTLPIPCGSGPMILGGCILLINPNKTFKDLLKDLKWHIITKIKMRKNK